MFLNIFSFYLDACLIIYMISSNYLSFCQLPVLPLRKSYSKIGPLWSIRCLNYLNPWKVQLAILAVNWFRWTEEQFYECCGGTYAIITENGCQVACFGHSTSDGKAHANQHGHLVTMVTILLNGNPERCPS